MSERGKPDRLSGLGLHRPLGHPDWLYSSTLSFEERRGLLAAQRLVDAGEAEWVEASEQLAFVEWDDDEGAS